MIALAAAAQPGGGTLLGLVLVVALIYLVDCAVYPRRKHGACGGTGKLKSPISRGERDCWCDRGRRRKLGARLLGRGKPRA